MKRGIKLFTMLFTTLTLGIGVATSIGFNDVNNVKAETFTEINETCFIKVDGNGTDAHFVIHLTNWDYETSESLHIYEGSYSTYEHKFNALDTINYLKINGEAVNFDTYNSEGFKLKREIHINAHEPRNTISFRIGFEGSKTMSDITSIGIDKGCLLPSKAYLESNTNTAYRIPSNVHAIPQAVNWGWLTYVDTEVYEIYSFDNTYLSLTLSVNDYPTTFKEGSISYNGLTNFTDRNYLALNNGVSVYEGYGLISYQNKANTIWVRTSANSSTVTSVSIKEGLILPSYHLLGLSNTSPSWPMVFNVVNTHTFTYRDGAWVPLFDEVETSVLEVDHTSINGEWLSFKLSNSDYTTFRQASFSASHAYNMWSEIVCYDANGNTFTLNDAANSGNIFNYANNNENEISFNLKASYQNGFITKIVIPEGTEFPDFSYINGATNGRPKAYVVSEEITFVYATNASSQIVYAKVIDTEVVGMALVNSQYLGFTLTNNDYPVAGTVGGVNERSKEGVASNFNKVIDVSDVNTSFSDTNYCLWSYGAGHDNTIFGTLSDTSISAGIITIPSGTLFPSYEYSKDANVYPTVYRTTMQHKFKYDGNTFTDISTPWAINTTISNVTSHGNYASSDCAIDLYTADFDWPNSFSDLVLSSYIDSFSTKYNLKDFICCYDSNDNLIEFSNEFFVNVWGAKGCYSIRLYDAANAMQRLSYIVIKKGLQLPTYAGEYVTGKVGDNSYYLINQTAVFTHNYSEHSFTKVVYKETATEINSVTEINTFDQNSYISLGLSNHDYSSVTENVNIRVLDHSEMYKLNLDEYITVNGEKLSSWDLFNSLGIYVSQQGEVLFCKKGNNTGYYYIENGQRVYTEDLTTYEISIAAGCQFPSYEYLTGETATPKCFTVNSDYRFAYFNGAYVREDASFEEITVNKLKVTNVGLQVVNSSDKCFYLTIDKSDWPTNATVSNAVLSNVNRFLSQIEVFDKDGNLHLPRTTEVFVNVWGAGSNAATIGFRTDIDNLNNVDYVRVHTGTLFPTYANHSSSGANKSWYEVVFTQSFYSGFDGVFYGADKTITANQFAKEFNSAFSEVCANYDGYTSNEEKLANKFHAFENMYNYDLAEEQKSLFVTGRDGEINKMLSSYQYVVAKYGLNNFLGISFINTNANILNIFGTNSDETLTYLVIISVSALTLTALFTYFKKRKISLNK